MPRVREPTRNQGRVKTFLPELGKNRQGSKKSVIICVCGLAGSGKSTVARRIARTYCLRYFSGGDALMALALEAGYKGLDRGWWESPEGMRFLKGRGNDVKFDKAVDGKLLEAARSGSVVLDSWTMPWLLKDGFKIWLEASSELRAARIANRDRMTREEALYALKKKEHSTRMIYRKLYHFNLGDDYEPFDLILDTEQLSAEEVFQTVRKVIDNVVFGKSTDSSRKS